MNHRRISRRHLLRGTGVAIALPMLESMIPIPSMRRASAAEKSAAPLRLMFFNVPNGIHMPDWTPTKEGKNFELPATLKQLATIETT